MLCVCLLDTLMQSCFDNDYIEDFLWQVSFSFIISGELDDGKVNRLKAIDVI